LADFVFISCDSAAFANNSVQSGNTVYVKAATYSRTTQLNVCQDTVTYIGYTSARGDASSPVTTLTTATNSISLVVGGANFSAAAIFQNFLFSTTAGTPGRGFDTNGSSFTGLTLLHCKTSGFSTHFFGDWNVNWSFNGLQLTDVEITSGTTGVLNSDGVRCIGCYIHGLTGDGVNTTTSTHFGFNVPWLINFSIIASNNRGIVDAVGNEFQMLVMNSSIANHTSDGFVNTGTAYTRQNAPSFMNNIFYGNGGWGINLPVNSLGALNIANAYGANTSGNRNHLAAGDSDVTLTANPFTNAGGDDYSLNNTAGGGVTAQAGGYPGLINPKTRGHLGNGPPQRGGSATSSYVQ
jgi:hypothetical protein